MSKIFTLLITILLFFSMFISCAKPNNSDRSDFDSQELTEKDDNKSTEDNGGSDDKNDGVNNNQNESENGNGKGDGSGNNGENDNVNGGADKDDSTENEKAELSYTRDGNYVYFGEYPQSLKKADVTVSDITDSRGYFLGSDNEYYAKLKASPYESGYKFSTDAAITSGTEYYFKIESLKWRILSESDGNVLLLCESIIENSRYDDTDNNYKDSEIRDWLNNNFYSKAFDELERALIQTVTVDNSINSTGHSVNNNVCENTEDKIFLLSYEEVMNSKYGFSDDISRMKLASDYSRAKGVWISKSVICDQYGNGLWMLRTPNNTYKHFIRECNFNGEITDGGTNINSAFLGVVPALKIKL